MFSQILGDAEKKKVDDELIPEKVVHMMRTSWETHRRAGMSRNNQQRANKLSAVKPAGNQPPQFQYQQQQRGEFPQQQRSGWGLGGGSKRGRQGKRGGQKNAQQQLQQTMVQQPEPSQQAGPSQPPSHQWVPATTPPSYTSGPANMGYFAAQMRAGRPLPPTPPTPYFPPSPPIQPTESFYPHFGVAMNLSRKLGIKPTIETVKKLEMAQQEMARNKSSDPRPTHNPQKCVRNSQQPRGKPQGLEGKGKGKAKDDDEVSLDNSEDELMEGYHDDKEMEEIDPLDQPGDNDMETQEFDMDSEVTDCAGLTFLRQVHSTPERTTINNSLQLDNYIAELKNKINCFHCSHGCDCKTDNTKEWLIDSGASEHFTYDINSFVDYEVLKNPSSVKTANSTAEVRGRGTVIIVLTTGDVVRISPVYHVPTLSCQLLAMGKFLQSGYTSTGNSTSIRIMKGSKTFLTFNPRR